MIQRFPREEVLKKGEGFSFNDVVKMVRRVSRGKHINPRAMVLICRWFGVPVMTKQMAKQRVRTGHDNKFRFPRERNA